MLIKQQLVIKKPYQQVRLTASTGNISVVQKNSISYLKTYKYFKPAGLEGELKTEISFFCFYTR